MAMVEATCPSSWTLEQIEAELDRQTGLVLVAISFTGEVQGWCCGFLVGPDAELLKISVSPQWRRQGIAKALLQELCRCFAAGQGKRFISRFGRRTCRPCSFIQNLAGRK